MSEQIKEFAARKKAWRSVERHLPMTEKVRVIEMLLKRYNDFRRARMLRVA